MTTHERTKPNHFDVEWASIFKSAICMTFCRDGYCRGCPAAKIDHATYKTMKIGELIAIRKGKNNG
jgi:hypothetical protein